MSTSDLHFDAIFCGKKKKRIVAAYGYLELADPLLERGGIEQETGDNGLGAPGLL